MEIFKMALIGTLTAFNNISENFKMAALMDPVATSMQNTIWRPC